MKRLNPTTVIACLALAFALGGTGYAARDALLPANSVGSKQVINHSIRKIDLKAPLPPRKARGDWTEGPRAPRADGASGRVHGREHRLLVARARCSYVRLRRWGLRNGRVNRALPSGQSGDWRSLGW